MSNNLYYLIASALSSRSNGSLYDLVIYPAGLSVIPTSDALLAANVVTVFLYSDLLAYFGVLVIVAILGLKYYSVSHTFLVKQLFNVSSCFLFLSTIGTAYGLLLGLPLLIDYSISVFDGSYKFNLYTQISKFIVAAAFMSLYVLFVPLYLFRIRSVEVPLLLQIAVAFSLTMLSSANFALLLLTMEGFSLLLYIMTALGRSYGGVTAAAKYFAFGTLGSVFLFWATAHLYSLLPTLSYDPIFILLNSGYDESLSLRGALEFASIGLATGFMVKLGAAPAHQWVSDVYAGVHMFITAFFSVVVKLVLMLIFAAILPSLSCDPLLKFFIFACLACGCATALKQVEVKRLIAYSSIVHVGFLLMGDPTASFIYLITYVLGAILLFSVVLIADLAGKEIIYLNELRFLRGSGYAQVGALVVALASSSGLPPLAGFYGKFSVWSSLIEDIRLGDAGYLPLYLSFTISLLTIYYYTRVTAYLFVGDDLQPKSASLSWWTRSFVKFSFIILQLALVLLAAFWLILHSKSLGIAQTITL